MTALLAKLDHAITPRQRVSIRGSFSRSSGDNIAGGSLLLSQATSNLETFSNQGTSIVASLSGPLGRACTRNQGTDLPRDAAA